MLRLTTFTIVLISLFILLFAVSCSNSTYPNAPSIENPSGIPEELPQSGTTNIQNRTPLAVYDAAIDSVKGTFTVTPDNRTAQYHFPLTQLYPGVLQITGYGFSPNFWADIKLVHPFPGSGITGFDPRVIAILPANEGVRFIYPAFGIGGNNAVVQEPDGYTKLFDALGGSIPGNVNPFKAYFKGQPYRKWSSTGVTEETLQWQMNLAGFGGPMQFKLVVDVSTNYPDTPTPYTDNAIEPVNIDAEINSDNLTSEGGLASVSAKILNWQYPNKTSDVQIAAPDFFDGISYMGCMEENFNEYYYGGTVYNTKLAPEGVYRICIGASDYGVTNFIYKEYEVTVNPGPPSGKLIWAKSAGGVNGDVGYAVTTLSDNSTVVTGRIQGTATFGVGELNQTTLVSEGGYDIFVARYNPDGTLAWAKHAGGTEYDEGFAITSFSDDSFVVTGYFIGSALFGRDEPNMTILYSEGTYDIFVAKYYSNGILQWAKRAGGVSDDGGRAVVSLSDHSTIVTGAFKGSATFGKWESNETILTADGNSDIFIAKYESDGYLAWAKRAGGTASEEGRGIARLSDDTTVVTGFYSGTTCTFGPGEANQTTYGTAGGFDIFIARYNTDGTLAWVKNAGGTGGDTGNGIAALDYESTVVTGNFTGTATFGAGESTETDLICTGNTDVFVARLKP